MKPFRRRVPNRLRLGAHLAAIACIPLLGTACSRRDSAGMEDGADGDAAGWAYEREATGGPVSLTVRLDRLECGLADRIRLEQELRVDPGFEADFPEFLPEDYEGFAVTDIVTDPAGESWKAPTERRPPEDLGTAAGSPKAPTERRPPEDLGTAADSPEAPTERRPPEDLGTAAGSPRAPTERRPPEDLGTAAGSPKAPTERRPPGEGGGAPAEPVVRRKRLLLEPERSGDLAIAPLAVFYNARDAAEESHFLTAEIPVRVRPIEDAGALELRPLRGIREAPPPESGGSPWPWIAGAGAAAALAGAAAVAYLRRRPRRAPPALPPHEIAYEQLRRLVAMDLIAKGDIERFFVLLSGILREYIENRFRVRAPERTTEEFLEEASRDPALDVHRARLGEFLELCDQVKFARYEPEEAAIQGAFDVTRRFIEETTRREP